jgi:hypothetical protein
LEENSILSIIDTVMKCGKVRHDIAIVIIAIHSRSKLGIRRLYERIELEPIKAKAVIAPVS